MSDWDDTDVPYSPSPPIAVPSPVFPRGGKTKQQIYMANFLISWKSLIFWASAIVVFVITLYILG